ncbi:hypothetical protein ACA910_020026 [Epithemia clementina (nom. ined.)]
MPGRVGHQDRRGFDGLMQGLMVVMAMSVLLMIVFSWKLGLAALMISAILFILFEAISAPPANGPRAFMQVFPHQVKRRPILVCLGDSLTHGNCSSTFTPDVPRKLADRLGMDPPSLTAVFADPLWVVNCGQNSITSYTIRKERLSGALNCSPDYILILIGTNDVRAMYKEAWAKQVVKINALPQVPSLENYESNLRAIIDHIQTQQMQTQIGVCTLPPLGEDLSSPANDWVRKVNTVIEKTVNSFNDKCSVVPVFQRFESILEKKPGKGKGISVDHFMVVAFFMNLIYHMLPGMVTWNALSKLVGNILLTDGVHLNDNGKDIIVDLVVEWLMTKNVAKAIAVKAM